MNKKKINIITGEGGHLGTGHFQRMCTLAVCLNKTGRYSAGIIIAQGSPVIPSGINNFIINEISDDLNLIIRDMRDSSSDEISLLRKKAPVLVIDDIGAGRSSADYILDLLPSPLSAGSFHGMFIYGYNFINSINNMNLYDFVKDIDVSIYAGYNPDMNHVNSLLKSMPDNASVVLFSKGKPSVLSGHQITLGRYTDTLLRSRILITHFGISMYEGELAGCRIVLVNPSPYHTQLTHLVEEALHVIPAGEYNSIDHSLIRSVVSGTREEPSIRIISSRSIKERINISLEYFTEYLDKICN